MRHKNASNLGDHVSIRALGAADTEAFKALRLLAIADSPAAVWPTAAEEAQRTDQETRAKIEPSATQVVFGAFSGLELIGMAGLRREPLIQVAHKAMVWGVFVLPTARAGGVARRLLARIRTHAAEIGVIQIHLSVNAENTPAKNLYTALGFETFGVEPRALRIGARFYDEEQMCLRLDA